MLLTPAYVFVSVGDEENRVTFSFRISKSSEYNFMDLSAIKVEDGIYIGELHAKQTDQAGIPKKELMRVNKDYLFGYCQDLALLTTDKVWQGARVLPALQESVKELDDPAGVPIPNKQIYLLIPDQDALLRVLRIRAEEVALSEEDVQLAYTKHKQALEKNLTKYELELYADSQVLDY